MDIKATPNSHKYKEEQEKKIKKVVSGKVKTKKKSEMSKFKDSIFAQDIQSVGSYLISDVLIPTIKTAIHDIIVNGADMMVYGETSKKKSPLSQVSYRNYSSKEKPYRENARASNRFDLDDIVFDSRGDAETVLDQMSEVLSSYGIVSVAELYDMIGQTAPFTANRWGWTSIRTADVIRGMGGSYYLKLPKPVPID